MGGKKSYKRTRANSQLFRIDKLFLECAHECRCFVSSRRKKSKKKEEKKNGNSILFLPSGAYNIRLRDIKIQKNIYCWYQLVDYIQIHNLNGAHEIRIQLDIHLPDLLFIFNDHLWRGYCSWGSRAKWLKRAIPC